MDDVSHRLVPPAHAGIDLMPITNIVRFLCPPRTRGDRLFSLPTYPRALSKWARVLKQWFARHVHHWLGVRRLYNPCLSRYAETYASMGGVLTLLYCKHTWGGDVNLCYRLKLTRPLYNVPRGTLFLVSLAISPDFCSIE